MLWSGLALALLLALPLSAQEIVLSGVTGLDGRLINEFAAGGKKALVLVFMSVDCPIANRYAPELQKLQAEFNQVRFVLVYPNPDDTSEMIGKNLRDYDLKWEAWRDPRHSVVKAAKVQVTPEAAVFVPETGWIYRGRIDDRYVDFGKQRLKATQHDLRDVLAAVTAGKPVTVQLTRAIGCHIPAVNE